ncbi:hypothetical protein AMTR_s00061p00034320 [Amborella trichopoda]|uniref:Uncharacterized protein n=1 Tax=Amborella trichopoda TaxID=13333 RepID=U5D9V9_AMBTC|nr:hypothetical protein AMTR_s00061p00034320 [Amborella trichopoda]
MWASALPTKISPSSLTLVAILHGSNVSRALALATAATGNTPRCSSSTCVYAQSYGDGSFSFGFFGNNTLASPHLDKLRCGALLPVWVRPMQQRAVRTHRRPTRAGS